VTSLVHLRHERVSVVADTSTGVPTIVYWGAPLGDDVDLDSIVAALRMPIANGSIDIVAPCSIVPEHGSGWPGRPGLAGRRSDGSGWAPRFVPAADPFAGRHKFIVAALSEADGLTVSTAMELEPASAALLVQVTLTNVGDTPYELDRLSVTLPVPAQATELLTFEGRWTREFHERRSPWPVGAFLAENRRGRTSHEHSPLVFAGEPSFGEWKGEVWGAHLAWSGNHDLVAEHLPDGRHYLQMGELLHPGEVVLEPGQSYTAPQVIAVYGEGLTPTTWGFHRHLRSRLGHPQSDQPRKVLLNTWEAVYFNHDTDVLKGLADAAAALGIERFVLDDGWFGSRRNDRRGLGDWWVSPDVYPDGLHPLINHVTGLGMEFGIWVEPEMVNPDSDLYRAHPEWALETPGYESVLGRQQLVLNLAHPGAFDEVLTRLDELLRDHDISYVKWDMNRDHIHGSGADGRAGTNAQTLALYRLLDELAERHPNVEIESCSSGGARIDAEILRRTVRVWTSDCNDALERVQIQRGASMLIPPEVMGAHIGPTRSHTTGRRHDLAFRATIAMFGHLGVEWNVMELDDLERLQLAEVIALHQRFRPLLHGGDTVRFDRPDDAGVAQGVYDVERTEAVVSYAQVRSAPSLTPAPLRLPGLDPDRVYEVRHLPLPGLRLGPGRVQPEWMTEGLHLMGRQLATHGIQLPVLNPETAILLHLTSE
jgi:alpha-galactosidase